MAAPPPTEAGWVDTAVEKISGKKVPVDMGPRRAGAPPVLVASADRAHAVLEWKAPRDLETIVRDAHACSTRG